MKKILLGGLATTQSQSPRNRVLVSLGKTVRYPGGGTSRLNPLVIGS